MKRMQLHLGRRGLVLGGLGAALLGTLATGGGAATLTLEAAARRALARYPAVQAAAARAAQVEAEVGIAKAAWLPRLGLSGVATRYEETMLVYPIHGFAPNLIPPFSNFIVQGSLSAQYLLVDGGGRSGRVREARAQSGAAEAAAVAATQETLQRVVVAFLEVLGRREVLAAHDHRLQALAAERARVVQLVRAGRVADVDLLRAEAEMQRAAAERVERATLLSVAEAELGRLVALPADSTRALLLVRVALADSILPGADTLAAAARAANPRLLQAAARAAAAVAATAVARGERWPSISLFARENGWSDADGNDALEWNAGALLEYPLFTGGARRSAIAAAQAASRRAGAEAALVTLEVQRSVDDARAVATAAQALRASLSVAVARFREVARIRKLALDTGTGTQTDYLDAEADLLDAQARHIEARHREITARAALALHTGQLDLEWLGRNLENQP